MLQFLAQGVSYGTNYNYTTTNTSSLSTGAALAIGLVVLVLVVFLIVAMWRVFEKAGDAGWKAIIPFYNAWVLAEIAGKPGWWGLASLLTIIPFLGYIVSIVVYVLIYIGLAKAFGKGTGFAVLLIFLPFIGLPILAFGPATYAGPHYHTDMGSKPTAVPPAAA